MIPIVWGFRGHVFECYVGFFLENWPFKKLLVMLRTIRKFCPVLIALIDIGCPGSVRSRQGGAAPALGDIRKNMPFSIT